MFIFASTLKMCPPVTPRQYFKTRAMAYALLTFFSFFIIPESIASADVPDHRICHIVATEAEEAFNLPSGILSSIAQVESGRKTTNGDYRSWPWTINDKGKGLFFDNRLAANKYIIKQNEVDNTNIDIGCMQISVKWHAQAFSSPESMLDPYTNIAYAAIFLEELYKTHGNWESAIKYYHSADTKKNEPYLQKVNAVWKNQPPPSVEPTTASTSFIALENLKLPRTINIEPKYPNDLTASAKRDIKGSNSALATGLSIKTDRNFITSPNQDESKPPGNFTIAQPYLANEWKKVLHFRKLFATE